MHRLKPRVNIVGTHNRDFVSRQMLLLTFVQHLEASFFVFQQDSAPNTSRQRHRSASASRCLILSHPLSGCLTYIGLPQPGWLVTTPCGVCFGCESIVYTKISDVDELKRRINSEWPALSHSHRLLNVLLASGVSVYTRLRSCWRQTSLAHAVIKTMWYGTCNLLRDTETITASHVCRHSVNHSNVHLIIVLTAQSNTSNFPM